MTAPATSSGYARDGGTGAPEAFVLIGDLAASRELGAGRRQRVQEQLGELVTGLNREFGTSLMARLTITLGDEFQGVLSDPGVLPDLTWRLAVGLPEMRIWTGVGRGAIETELRDEAVGMDGPAFHRARDALEEAKRSRRHGGVFEGFGDDDPVLGGLARMVDRLRADLTDAQTEAVDLARRGMTQREVAERLGVTPQAVSQRLAAAGWKALREGEEALEILLHRWAVAPAAGGAP